MKKVLSALAIITTTVVLSGCLFGKKDEAPVEAPAATEAPAAPTEQTPPAEGAAPAEQAPAAEGQGH